MTSSEKLHVPVPNPTRPYWLEGAKHVERPEGSSNVRGVDVLVIGCGMTGVSVAHWLTGGGTVNRHLSITLVDARAAGTGATGRNGGHLYPSGLPNPVLARYSKETALHLWQFEQDCAKAVEEEARRVAGGAGLTKKGALMVLKWDEEWEEAEQGLRELGSAAAAELVGREELRERYGLDLPRCKGALWSPAASWRPIDLHGHLLSGVLPHVNLVEHTTVDSLTSSSGLWHAHLSSGHSISARTVVLATNAYSQHLHPCLRCIVPTRGQCVLSTLKIPCNICLDDGDTYAAPTPEGCVLGGKRAWSPSKEENTSDDAAVSPEVGEGLRYVLDELAQAFGCPDPPQILQEWTGIMGFTPDGLPLVGSVGAPGLYCAAGFTGEGMPKVFFAARLVAELLLSDLREPVPHPVSAPWKDWVLEACSPTRQFQ